MKNMSRNAGDRYHLSTADSLKGNSLQSTEERDNSVVTEIGRLSSEERVGEIARMLSGAEVTEQAVANARVMLETN